MAVVIRSDIQASAKPSPNLTTQHREVQVLLMPLARLYRTIFLTCRSLPSLQRKKRTKSSLLFLFHLPKRLMKVLLYSV